MNNKNKNDNSKCIEMLLDKSLDQGTREDAADSLMYHPEMRSCDVLLEIILDESEDEDFKLELSGTLGSILRDLKTMDHRVNELSQVYKQELLYEYNLLSNED